MVTRRSFLGFVTAASMASEVFGKFSRASTAATQKAMTIRPYRWEGPYAEFRARDHALHDWRLCAELSTPWPGGCERLILRTSEVIGYETGFLYDDHFPPSEPEGRGKDYHHIPFEWHVVRPDTELAGNCPVPGKGKFSIHLTAQGDALDIHLSIRNDMPQPMENPDWAFCVVAFESPSISDPEDTRTYLFDGEKMRTLAELAGRDMALYKVSGANGYIPPGHRHLRIGPVQAKASLVAVEGVDDKHSAALAFEQSDSVYGDSKGNKCFHADPYFGPSIKTGEERSIRGKLYVIEGNAEDALRRYRRDFRA